VRFIFVKKILKGKEFYVKYFSVENNLIWIKNYKLKPLILVVGKTQFV
jgi:hypothetical protein